MKYSSIKENKAELRVSWGRGGKACGTQNLPREMWNSPQEWGKKQMWMLGASGQVVLDGPPWAVRARGGGGSQWSLSPDMQSSRVAEKHHFNLF